MIAYLALIIGFALIGYGLTPLSGSRFPKYISERGCLSAIIGVGVISLVTVVKVLG